ncbi:MAG: ABC transporter permease subunit [Euryarchaeota archaeon]|nr:ABC transporter permease subunit [Euryarchaeota archaeon]
MSLWKVILLMLKEYHYKKYIYYLPLFCIAPVVSLPIIIERIGGDFVGGASAGLAMGIGFFCPFAMVLIGMQTYSPKIRSGAVVLDITKPLTRRDYFVGKFIANIVVLVLCAVAAVGSFSVLLSANGYDISYELFSGFSVLVIPLLVLSATSVINLYLSMKATGISAFVACIICMRALTYLDEINYNPTVTLMEESISVISLGMGAISVFLVVVGILLFIHKEL